MASKKSYTYHNNSRIARYFAEKRGGKYIGFMGDLELQLEIIKDNNRDKDIKMSKSGAYVVEYDKWPNKRVSGNVPKSTRPRTTT